MGLRSFFALLVRKCMHCIALTKRFRRARGVHSKVKNFWRQFHWNPAISPFWADGTKAHQTALMCINAIESKYQLLNKCKMLFDLVVHQQQHLHSFWQHSIRLTKFERNFTKHNFYFVTRFMSKRNFYFETEGVHVMNSSLYLSLWLGAVFISSSAWHEKAKGPSVADPVDKDEGDSSRTKE